MTLQPMFENSLRRNMQHALTASVKKVCHPPKVKPNQPMPLQRTTPCTPGVGSRNDTDLSESPGRCLTDRAISPRSRIANLFDETAHCPACSWTTFAKMCGVLVSANSLRLSDTCQPPTHVQPSGSQTHNFGFLLSYVVDNLPITTSIRKYIEVENRCFDIMREQELSDATNARMRNPHLDSYRVPRTDREPRRRYETNLHKCTLTSHSRESLPDD